MTAGYATVARPCLEIYIVDFNEKYASTFSCPLTLEACSRVGPMSLSSLSEPEVFSKTVLVPVAATSDNECDVAMISMLAPFASSNLYSFRFLTIQLGEKKYSRKLPRPEVLNICICQAESIYIDTAITHAHV